MEITLPILILAIPIAMFLILGIGGVVMPRKLAGVLGILGMGTCLVLAYTVAFTYFFSGARNLSMNWDSASSFRYLTTPGWHLPTNS